MDIGSRFRLRMERDCGGRGEPERVSRTKIGLNFGYLDDFQEGVSLFTNWYSVLDRV